MTALSDVVPSSFTGTRSIMTRLSLPRSHPAYARARADPRPYAPWPAPRRHPRVWCASIAEWLKDR
ncbi:hypothetical protein GCM10010335_67300 [Streptomyces galbus]|nr:hypothetical protein GCM10010335_67300 [Streptomyces galbus]